MMFFLLFFIVLIPFIKSAPTNNDTNIHALHGYNTRIINGEDALPGQFPWQVGLFLDEVNFCGGSLIDYSGWILTAGHCTNNHYTGGAVIGLTFLPYAVRHPIDKMFVHPYYNPQTLANDVGLVKLVKSVNPTLFIQTIPLATLAIQANKNVVVSGWGKTNDNPSSGISNNLKFVQLRTTTKAKCQETYGDAINDGIICVESINGKSTCSGDSGGPLIDINTNVQVGIVSFGSIEGCTLGLPTGFTRISSYLAWIRYVTQLQF